MLKKLKLLLAIRSWLTSKTMFAGGFVGFVAAAEMFIKSDEGMTALQMLAGVIGLSYETLVALALGVTSLTMVVLRAFTEWGLDEKLKGMHKAVLAFLTVGLLSLSAVQPQTVFIL